MRTWPKTVTAKGKDARQKKKAQGWVEFTRTATWVGKLLDAILNHREDGLPSCVAATAGCSFVEKSSIARCAPQVWNLKVLYRFL